MRRGPELSIDQTRIVRNRIPFAKDHEAFILGYYPDARTITSCDSLTGNTAREYNITEMINCRCIKGLRMESADIDTELNALA